MANLEYRRVLGKGTLFFVCLILVMLLAGCSQTPRQTDKVVHLRFSVLGTKQESDLSNELARQFEKTHPNIKINVEPVSGMGYDMKLIMQSAAGTLPDVMFLSDNLVPEFIKFKIIKDLTYNIKNDPTFNIKDIYPQMLDTGMDSRGHIYMLPRELGVVCLFYNKTLFKRAKVAYPTPNWTYDDFVKAAKALTIRDKNGAVIQYGFQAPYSWAGIYATWVAANGGSVIDKNGNSTLSDPKTLKALHTLIDLVVKDKVAMPPNQSLTAPGIDPFVAGKVAMITQLFPQVPQFRATMKQFDWDTQIMPAGKCKRCVIMGAAGYGVSAVSKHPKEAWEFLKFILSRDGQKAFGRTGSGIPALKSLANDKCWRIPGQRPKNLDAFIKSVNYGMSWQTILPFAQTEVNDRVSEAFEKVFTTGTPVETAFKEADVKINKILAKERKDE